MERAKGHLAFPSGPNKLIPKLLKWLLIIGIFFPMIAIAPNSPSARTLIIIQGNSLKAVAEPGYTSPRQVAIDNLLKEIVKRESNGNPTVCNRKYGCKAGMGLTQLIPTTVQYCEKKLGKSIDPFDPDDNLECARWLLEHEGIVHWAKWTGPYDYDVR